MFTKKTLVSALIGAAALSAAAMPLTSSAADFDVFFNFGQPSYDARADFGYRDDSRFGYRDDSRFGRHDDFRGRGHFQPSRWDRDGDGIPNRFDRTPDGVRARDRDHDRVPDRFDRFPMNPYRR